MASPDQSQLKICSRNCLAVTSQPNLLQLFQPMGGFCANDRKPKPNRKERTAPQRPATRKTGQKVTVAKSWFLKLADGTTYLASHALPKGAMLKRRRQDASCIDGNRPEIR